MKYPHRHVYARLGPSQTNGVGVFAIGPNSLNNLTADEGVCRQMRILNKIGGQSSVLPRLSFIFDET